MMSVAIRSIFLFIYTVSQVTCNDVQCQDGLTKQKVMMHAGSTFKFQSLAQFAELQCKAAYKNSRDCPQLKLSCATFDIPCNSTEVSVYTQCGGGHRMSHCRDNPPSLTTAEYLWVFLTESPGHPAASLDCSISCAPA